MLNQTILVGRLLENIKIEKTENDRTKVNMTLIVSRNYKNTDGVYDNDFIPCVLYDEIAKNISEWCNKGDLVGIRGRLQSDNDKLILIADKVTFLTSGKINSEREEFEDTSNKPTKEKNDKKK